MRLENTECLYFGKPLDVTGNLKLTLRASKRVREHI
jgi:hypothetical protein